MSIKTNIEAFRQQLSGTGCRLIVVSKTHPVERIREAYEAGHRLFGENKVQEMADKHDRLPPDIEWHLIGHLQTNKVKYIAPFVHLIHSVDSEKLMREINKQGQKLNRVIDCLWQVHIASEEEKFGTDEATIRSWLAAGLPQQLPFVRIRGLMGMATFTDDNHQIRSEFRQLRQLFELLQKEELPANVEMQELSMGMSSDYQLALEEGSTLIRVGTAIFGARSSPA